MSSGDIFMSGTPVPLPQPGVTEWEDATVKDLSAGIERLAFNDQTPLPRRPAYGAQGRHIVLRTNHFKMTFSKPDMMLYRYAVSIRSTTRATDGAADSERMPTGKKRRFFELLMHRIRSNPKLAGLSMATDFSSQIVTNAPLSLNPHGTVFPITYYDRREQDLPPATQGEDISLTKARDLRTRDMCIQPDNTCSTLSLGEFIQYFTSGGAGGFYPHRGAMLQALNIILNMPTLEDPGVVPVGQNKFYPVAQNPLARQFDLGEGLEALRGYYSSVRIAANRLLINANVSCGAFYKEGDLNRLINAFTRNGWPKSSDNLYRLHTFLAKLKIMTNHTKQKNAQGQLAPIWRVRTIFGVPEHHSSNGAWEVDRNANVSNTRVTWQDASGRERTTTIRDFFAQKHNVHLRDGEGPMVNCGNRQNPSWIPTELCTVLPGQSAKRMLSATQTRNMIRFAARPPNANATSITTDGLRLLRIKDQHDQQATHNKWDIHVDPNMITIPGRVLNPPQLQFKGSMVTPSDGFWNMNGKTFHRGCQIRDFVCLYISEGSQTPDACPTVRIWIENARRQIARYGVSIGQCTGMRAIHLGGLRDHDRSDTDQKINTEFLGWHNSQNKPALIWVIVPSKDVYLKAQLKFYGDCKAGIQTVLMQQKNIAKGSHDIFANMAAKLCLRFGGVPWSFSPAALGPLDGTYMIVGIDVTHPPPGSAENSPSIVAVTATVDGSFVRYMGDLQPQTGGVEMGSEVRSMIRKCLFSWRSRNGRLPGNIIIYRDGVSEGQFSQVLAEEYQGKDWIIESKSGKRKPGEKNKSICGAFQDLYGDEEHWPKVSIIVVGKRHHTRFYPTARGHASGKMLNVQPGTVVDRHITGSGCQLYDFFMVAHQGIQGTSKPAHYVVIKHGIKSISVDALERITFALCHTWQRAPRSVSYAPPAYYADLLAERGRMYLVDNLAAPVAGARRIYNRNTAEWQGGVHAKLQDQMFFV